MLAASASPRGATNDVMDRERAIALLRGWSRFDPSRGGARPPHLARRAGGRRGLRPRVRRRRGQRGGEIGAEDAPRVVVLLGHIDTVPGEVPVRVERRAPVRARHGRRQGAARDLRRGGRAAGRDVGARRRRAPGGGGAVEEEAASSKGARFVAARFDGGASRCRSRASSASRAAGIASRSGTRDGCWSTSRRGAR